MTMASCSVSRKRSSSHIMITIKESSSSSCVGQQEKLSFVPKPRQETQGSKRKKRMLEESGSDGLEQRNATISSGEIVNECIESVLCNFQARHCLPPVYATKNFQLLLKSNNVAHYLYGASLGTLSPLNKKSVLSPITRELQNLSLFRTASPFDRRVTALEWHPTISDMLVAGSKGGDIFFWNILQQNLNDSFIHGIGAGGSIQAVKIWPWNTDFVLTASVDGRVMLRDSEQRHCQILSDTFNCTDFWYCCVDVNAPRKVVITGDNVGNTLLLSLDGKQLWSHRLHKQKVTHAEFSPREDWLLCTASTDTTVKVWDVRKISGRDSALFVLKHDKPVNSAYFSRTDGCRLLTTDQYSQLRVYCTSSWHLERTVYHPHRFFQHITPIKATWHPLQDLIVVGRYPSKDFPGYREDEHRTIDIFDAESGKIMCQLHDPLAPGIVSLNKFSKMGDYLASGMGVNLLLWGRKQEVEDRQLSLLADHQHIDLDPMRRTGDGTGSHSATPRS